jgi:HD-like signal output (HDOD) protein
MMNSSNAIDLREPLRGTPLRDDEDLRLRELILKVDDLAVLPHVVFKVLELSGSSDTAAQDMERAITVDPGFSSKVLVLANSASYALPRKVTSIKEAIMFLGFKSVRYLAMTVGVFDLFVGKNDRESLRRRSWWRHSVDTAVCCRWLAERTRKLPPDEAFTAGLLHLIGKTLIDRFGRGDFEAVHRLVETGMADWEAERKVFGYDHVQVAQAASCKWHFPESLREGLDYTAAPEDGESTAVHRACTALGHAIAGIVTQGHSEEDEEFLSTIPTWAIAALGIDRGDLHATVDGATEAIAKAQLQI